MTSRLKERNTNLRTYRKDVKPKQAKVAVTDNEIEEALKNSKGTYTSAEQWMHDNCDNWIKAHSIRLRVIDDKHLLSVKTAAREAARTFTLEKAFSNVEKAIDDGDVTTSKWYIANSPEGKKAGFGAKVETEISNAEEKVFKIASLNIEGKTREEIMQMVKEAWGK